MLLSRGAPVDALHVGNGLIAALTLYLLARLVWILSSSQVFHVKKTFGRGGPLALEPRS
jgi:hypothetical protein